MIVSTVASVYFLEAEKETSIIPMTSPALPIPVALKGCLDKSYSATSFNVSPFFTGYGPRHCVIFEIVLILVDFCPPALLLFPPAFPELPIPELPIPEPDWALSPYMALDAHVNLLLSNMVTLTPPSSKFQSIRCTSRSWRGKGRKRTMKMTPCAKYFPVFHEVKTATCCIRSADFREFDRRRTATSSS